MSADRKSFMISKPLIDANTGKRMPTSAVQLLNQSSYLEFFLTHLTLISYVRIISFELHKFFNSFRRKSFLQLILFGFNQTIYFSSLSFTNLMDKRNFVFERVIIFVGVVLSYMEQQKIQLGSLISCIVQKYFNLVFIF